MLFVSISRGTLIQLCLHPVKPWVTSAIHLLSFPSNLSQCCSTCLEAIFILLCNLCLLSQSVVAALCYSAWLCHKELSFVVLDILSSCRRLLGCPSASLLPDLTSLNPCFPQVCAPCLILSWKHIWKQLQSSQISTAFGSPHTWWNPGPSTQTYSKQEKVKGGLISRLY